MLVTLTILCALMFWDYAHSQTTFVGPYFSGTFPKHPLIQIGDAPTPAGPVRLHRAQHTEKGLWLFIQHADIPPGVWVSKTHEDIARLMLGPVGEASTLDPLKMELERARFSVKANAEGYFTWFEHDGCVFFSGVALEAPHAWMVATMDCDDDSHTAVNAFLDSVRFTVP